MSRPCTICQSPNRKAIDEAILNGESERQIAVRFGSSQSSVHRHKAHPPAAIVKVESVQEIQEALTIADKLVEMERETKAILAEARAAIGKDNDLALRAIARLEKQYELRAKIEGELPEGGVTVQVLTQEIQIRDQKSAEEMQTIMEAVKHEADPETARRIVAFVEQRRNAGRPAR